MVKDKNDDYYLEMIIKDLSIVYDTVINGVPEMYEELNKIK